MRGEPNGGVFMPVNLNLYGYVQNNPVNAIDPNGEYCLAVGGTVTCRLPGQNLFPKFSFDRPEGWPTYIGDGELFYHIYFKGVSTDGVMQGDFGTAMREVICRCALNYE